ncbi:hypothetical protein AUC69_10990 [Methyloceanibacter superfactus]|jgi:ElaB/YqjD/DUF883 family membrane-anchored ribosome-binding protein|uniref:DUF883 domain-containing protein n=1 Tax=Methyloceanibacter superfactus TaxID=1774969 RepID=A0A1E3VVP5_9HYPH|nr:DUF883 family protein [Methyloceanibacter superfactus]ODR97628.1 hypothetical protein AUC69_10990 [Methyloceanibacter superfactus]
MAQKDADMPDHLALSEDLQQITKHLSNLRKEIDSLVHSIGRTGSHQADNLKAQADEAQSAVEDAVRESPFASLGIALGIGFLLGILLRR